MGLPQNETNLLSLLRSPAKRSIFSVHKVKWHFPSRCPWRRVKYLRRCRPTPVSQVCVEQGRRPPKKRKQTPRRPNLEPPPTRRFTEETAASGEKKREKKNRQGSSQRDIRFETWVFCFHMNSQAPSDRWGMEISHYERQISLLFWFCGGHKAKCGISEIILKRNYALKNSSPVWLAEGRWMG